MPLPIAHGLVGASIVALVHPNANLKNWKPLLIAFILANCADLDFGFSIMFGWQGFHRGLTHSFLFAFIVACVIFIFLRRLNWKIPLAYSVAFLSHTILDYLSSKRGGVRLLTPFDNTSYGFGQISFSELSRGIILQDIIYFSIIEMAVFTPIFIIVVVSFMKIKNPT